MLAAQTSNNMVILDHFVEGCMRMRGHATSLDLQTLLYQMKVHQQRARDYYKAQSDVTMCIEQRLEDLAHSVADVSALVRKQKVPFRNDDSSGHQQHARAPPPVTGMAL
mmetsp:Transcript_60647/g.136674  ORF Transcript_60647/g.136674 Transcript_60647/m.136674 type:complete len:109 (+) Transcript_60647:1-327(+)